MPFCNQCGIRIQAGRLCDLCVKDDHIPGYDPGDGPEYVDCDNCRGRSWVRGADGGKVDCPVCDGFGKVRVVADGGDSA